MKKFVIVLAGAVLLLVLALYRVPLSRQLFAESQQAGAPQPKVKVGDMAPDFTLRDQTGKEVSLKDFRGKKNVVLAFYVFAFSSG
jgi:cytochrome oxidase Cu insertion factor (SCO1/SenC/PrrC family)